MENIFYTIGVSKNEGVCNDNSNSYSLLLDFDDYADKKKEPEVEVEPEKEQPRRKTIKTVDIILQKVAYLLFIIHIKKWTPTTPELFDDKFEFYQKITLLVIQMFMKKDIKSRYWKYNREILIQLFMNDDFIKNKPVEERIKVKYGFLNMKTQIIKSVKYIDKKFIIRFINQILVENQLFLNREIIGSICRKYGKIYTISSLNRLIDFVKTYQFEKNSESENDYRRKWNSLMEEKEFCFNTEPFRISLHNTVFSKMIEKVQSCFLFHKIKTE